MKIRVSNYYPVTAWTKQGVRCISRLDNEKPVVVMNDNFYVDYCSGKALNLYEILRLYKMNIPLSEDWYIAYQSGFDFEENLRDRLIQKYTKGMVYNIMLRLATHNIVKCFSYKDIFKRNFKGEFMSYFKPYNIIHIEE